ncbi:MAG TPA: ATP-binding cassette domain-containing protein, partial [Ktedonobacterales bacterium]|nr:ATP-binding cassette domain-containing protein [Ktedonobacterales bacterium]
METSAATNPTAPATPPAGDILKVDDLVMHFPIMQGIIFQRQVGAVRAVDGVSFAIKRGETLGLVGESGSGKSTIGRCLVRLYQPTSGHMVLAGDDLGGAQGSALRTIRQRVQMIFQDPYASLDPRMTVGSLISEPMVIYKTGTRSDIRARTEELLRKVGLNPQFVDRYPHEFSGGQRQRIAIARAISIEPQFIVADEPVSAL